MKNVLTVYLTNKKNEETFQVISDSVGEVEKVLKQNQTVPKILFVNARNRFCIEANFGEIQNYYYCS